MTSRIGNKEMDMLNGVAGSFARYPLQINKLLEADAEIIDFENTSFRYLVLKVDGIHEEIHEKLYEDPYLVGWMSVTVTISDIAAVGAKPFGILLGLQLPRLHNEDWMKKFQQGINAACFEYGVSILGGDTNFGSALSVTTTGVATIQKGKPLLRSGIEAGHLLYATGKLGLGNAFAYSIFFDKSIAVNYQPLARLKESELIKDFATACIDTSDGLFPALSILSEINSIGIQVIAPLRDLLHTDALKVHQSAGIPSWMLMAGPHGEYELLFAISPAKQQEFESACLAANFHPVFIGKFIAGDQVSFASESLNVTCYPAVIANLFDEANGDIHFYFELLKKQHTSWS